MEETEGMKKTGGLRKALAVTLFTATVGVGSYMLGTHNALKQDSGLEKLAQRPVAAGFLNYPNDYTISVRLNEEEKRVVYLQDRTNKVEVPLSDATMQLEDTYQGKGKYILEGAMKTVQVSRKMYNTFGGKTEGLQTIVAEK